MQFITCVTRRANHLLGHDNAKWLDRRLKTEWINLKGRKEVFEASDKELELMQSEWDAYYDQHATIYLDEIEKDRAGKKSKRELREIKLFGEKLIKRHAAKCKKRPVWKFRALRREKMKAA